MNRLVTFAHLAVLATTALVLTACKDPPDTQNPPTAAAEQRGNDADSAQTPAVQAVDVCALLTDEEFQQATGFAVDNKKSWPGAAPGCDWELKSDSRGLHRLAAELRSEGGRKRFDFVTQSLPAIPDLGDAAAKTGGNINGTVWAVKGDTLVTMNYSLPVTTADPDPVVVPLVRLILSRQ